MYRDETRAYRNTCKRLTRPSPEPRPISEPLSRDERVVVLAAPTLPAVVEPARVESTPTKRAATKQPIKKAGWVSVDEDDPNWQKFRIRLSEGPAKVAPSTEVTPATDPAADSGAHMDVSEPIATDSDTAETAKMPISPEPSPPMPRTPEDPTTPRGSPAPSRSSQISSKEMPLPLTESQLNTLRVKLEAIDSTTPRPPLGDILANNSSVKLGRLDEEARKMAETLMYGKEGGKAGIGHLPRYGVPEPHHLHMPEDDFVELQCTLFRIHHRGVMTPFEFRQSAHFASFLDRRAAYAERVTPEEDMPKEAGDCSLGSLGKDGDSNA